VHWVGAILTNSKQAQEINAYYVNGEIAGIYKGYQNLNYVVINETGHFANLDQPQNVLGIIDSSMNNYWQINVADVE